MFVKHYASEWDFVTDICFVDFVSLIRMFYVHVTQ